jgi:anti-sigma regulatory factor (Ser/Thr protein kinase)
MNKIKVSSKIENLEKVVGFVHNQLANLDIPQKNLFQLDLAIEEAYVNIAKYAYIGREGEVLITSNLEENPLKITIQFIDQGIPYNPLKNKDPDVSLNAEQKEIGGLGILLIKNNVDYVGYEYRDGNNILALQKKLND